MGLIQPLPAGKGNVTDSLWRHGTILKGKWMGPQRCSYWRRGVCPAQTQGGLWFVWLKTWLDCATKSNSDSSFWITCTRRAVIIWPMQLYTLQDSVRVAVNRHHMMQRASVSGPPPYNLTAPISFPRLLAELVSLKNDVVHARHGRVTETGFDSCFTCSCILTESLAFLRSCSSSSAADDAAAVGSIASFSKHADPREELFCWYVMSCDTGSLGLPHADSSGLLPVAPEAAPGGCSRDCTQAPLVPGAASPPKDASPSKAAGVEHRLGWDDENTRSSCFFFLLNIHNPDSFLLPSAPPVPRRSEPSLGLSHGLVFSWKFFHILRW